MVASRDTPIMNAPVDYDLTDIPATYDRGHDHGGAVLAQWMQAVAAQVDPAGVHAILDLACGTGRFAPSLSDWFDAKVIGLDPSMKMLGLAQAKCAADDRVLLAGGCGEALPLQSQSIDLIFISMVFHHFADPALVGRECARVLRPGGHVCLRTITRDQIPHYPYLPFFPGARAVLERRLPTTEASCAAFEGAGLRRQFAGVVVQHIADDYAAYADKLASGADTTLASLDRREFEAGLAAIRTMHLDAGPPTAVVEPIDFMVFQKHEENA
jgi:ubiquinone/menaquinone biosynthesis C-methylase UbiE